VSDTWKIEQPDQIVLGDAVRSLRMSAAGGRFNVVGTDGPATLEVTKVTVKPLFVELVDGELTIRHGEGPQFHLLGWLMSGRKQEVELSLALPPDCLVDLRIASGPVVVSNFHEAVEVQGVSSEITLAGIHGAATVQAVSGAITAEQVTGDLTAKTVSGAITVIAAAGNALELSTVSGALTLDLDEPVPGSIRMQCVSGALTVRLPHDPDVRVDLGTTSGRAVSAFPQITARNIPGSGRLSGTIGEGLSVLRGQTVSGPVTLLRRDEEEALDEPDEDDYAPRDAHPDETTGHSEIEDAR
jgi:Putative adhesin